MILRIKTVRAAGEIANERVVIDVTEGGDIGDHAIFATDRYDKGGPTAGGAKCYWFPDKLVKAGDLVIVYSKHGKTSVKVNKSGSSSHFFYWDETEAIWDKYVTVVCLIDEFDVYDPSPDDPDELPS